jgi:ABC-type multidrug transport system ATPase subunit
MSTAGDDARASAIEVEELRKVYAGGTTALAGVSFAVGQGEVFGFLGPKRAIRQVQ